MFNVHQLFPKILQYQSGLHVNSICIIRQGRAPYLSFSKICNFLNKAYKLCGGRILPSLSPMSRAPLNTALKSDSLYIITGCTPEIDTSGFHRIFHLILIRKDIFMFKLHMGVCVATPTYWATPTPQGHAPTP